jgi:AAA domain
MTFSLQQIKKTRSDLPPRTLIYGPHKVGKSSFASCAPAPIFIQTEDGLDAIDADAFPLCQSWDDVLAAVGSLYGEAHDFKTVVLDSADWAEKLLHATICKDKGYKSIEDKGYGKGYVEAAERFAELLDGLGALRTERGMGVVVLCHAEIKRFDDPMADSYDRYQLKLHRQVAKLLSEWSDTIGFAQTEVMTKSEEQGFSKERTRALTTGRRVLRLVGSPSYDAGNRYGLPDTIDLTWAAYQAALDNARKGTTK